MKPTDLRGILKYVPQFRDKTFILSVDGAIVTDENFPNLLLDVAVLRSLNIRVVLVHGISAQLRALAEEQGVPASDLDGSGVTDAATLRLALLAANRLTHEILEGLSANDLRAAATNAIVAHPMGIRQGVDHLFTGRVERVDVELLETLLSHDIIPVIPPLGFDGDGRTYRVNSDSVALAVAQALRAVKLMFITTSQGLYWRGQLIRQMMVGELETLLEKSSTDFAPESLSKAHHAAAACRSGVQRVHIINGREDEGLLAEVFSNEGIGTLIYADEYQQIRPARKKDVRAILALTRQAVQSDELVKRTRADIERSLADFYIFEIDQNPVACVALHPWPECGKGELACLYVNPSHENQGIGRKLIQFIESKARELGLSELFALSTQAFTYFQSKAGFAEGSPEDLPPARREKYEQSGRRSKVLIKKLR
ncbi:MAG: amino-acid N-acetyltransferase [Verrucomicrobiae bacterium]|nr:amino-acid N-acetyltransferase [Verrucomicrobiae bacterium]MDW8309183.1 amino-acid N-acetyltransferase [Verrucomicrobiales bacterium]